MVGAGVLCGLAGGAGDEGGDDVGGVRSIELPGDLGHPTRNGHLVQPDGVGWMRLLGGAPSPRGYVALIRIVTRRDRVAVPFVVKSFGRVR